MYVGFYHLRVFNMLNPQITEENKLFHQKFIILNLNGEYKLKMLSPLCHSTLDQMITKPTL